MSVEIVFDMVVPVFRDCSRDCRSTRQGDLISIQSSAFTWYVLMINGI